MSNSRLFVPRPFDVSGGGHRVAGEDRELIEQPPGRQRLDVERDCALGRRLRLLERPETPVGVGEIRIRKAV